MKLKGTVLWYDAKEGRGIIEADGREYYVSSDVLDNVRYLDAKDLVQFEHNPAIPKPPCAYKVEMVSAEGDVLCPQCGTTVAKEDYNMATDECEECHDNSGLAMDECGCERCYDNLVSKADFYSED